MGRQVTIILGTRPEIVKTSSVIKELESRDIEVCQINTGQHYDYDMNQSFIEELGLRLPDSNLKVGGSSQLVQLSRILLKLEKVLTHRRPNLVLVQGDTNTTLGGALAAAKLGIPLGHIEAGCRSFDWEMPEEMNRVLTDDLANIHFAPTVYQKRNLVNEGISRSHIHVVGDSTVELLDHVKDSIEHDRVLKQFDLLQDNYHLLTVHRVENVTNRARLFGILQAASDLAKETPVVFPMHPHTRLWIRRHKISRPLASIKVVAPQPYRKMLALISGSCVVLTDSGGIQHEAPLLQKYCVTLRRTTEWIETIKLGINFLAGTDSLSILKTVRSVKKMSPFPREKHVRMRRLLGDGSTSKTIADICTTSVATP